MTTFAHHPDASALGVLLDARAFTVARANRRILDAIDLRAEAGEFIALTGLNGAGKSTLLEAVSGVLPAASGSCAICGRDLSRWDRRELSRMISYLPQGSGGADGYRVREVVAMGRFPHSGGWVESPDDREAIEGAMREAQCEQLASRLFQELSGGEKQRVLLAAALAQQTPVLLLDEPAAHVDLPQQLQMYGLLRERANTGRNLIVAATHDLRLAGLHATRLILLHRGVIAYDGDPKALFTAPVFTQVFGEEAAGLFTS